MKRITINRYLTLALFSLIFIFGFSSINSVINSNKELPKKLKLRLEGRYIYDGVEEAGFVFNPKSDTLLRIDEDNYKYPTKYRIEWISDSVFTYSDFKSTEYGVARVKICSVSKLEKNRLEIIEHFSGLCNIEPNIDIDKYPKIKVVLNKEVRR